MHLLSNYGGHRFCRSADTSHLYYEYHGKIWKNHFDPPYWKIRHYVSIITANKILCSTFYSLYWLCNGRSWTHHLQIGKSTVLLLLTMATKRILQPILKRLMTFGYRGDKSLCVYKSFSFMKNDLLKNLHFIIFSLCDKMFQRGTKIKTSIQKQLSGGVL